MRIRLRRLAVMTVAAVLVGCQGEPPSAPASPEAAARELFRFAGPRETRRSELERVFDLPARDETLSTLRDALASLPDSGAVRVAPAERLPGVDRAVVEIDVELAGGGEARFELQARPCPDGTWRVAWFGGPGVAWPALPEPDAEGLTVSSPPDSPVAPR